jgi:hypothetical protein
VADALLDRGPVRLAALADQDPHLQFRDRHGEQHLSRRDRIGDIEETALVLGRQPFGQR